MLRKILVFLFLVFQLIAVQAADWRREIAGLLNQGFSDIASASCLQMNPDPLEIKKALSTSQSLDELSDFLRQPEFKPASQRGNLQLHQLTGIDGKTRPWVLYIPDNYWHKRATPLLVALHGGVSRLTLHEDPLDWAKNSEWLRLAKNNGWFAIFPFGQAEATWWDEVGMTNIRRQLQLTRHRFNIDDDRVFLAGFSDGASAGFLHAMVKPDDFAAVVALNGHMGVGSLDGNLPTYAANMKITPVYAVTTDNDGLYPTKVMAPTIAMAINSGADIFYRQLSGEHSFSYAATELPIISDFLQNHSRSKFPPHLFWEAGSSQFGRCRYLEIIEVAAEPAAAWHKDANLEMISDRVSVGFMPQRVRGGVGVGKVMENTYAMKVGLKEGDVIIEAAGMPIRHSVDLDQAKSLVRRGDFLKLKVLRASATVELQGHLPPPEIYYLFKREVPSAAIKAAFSGNRIEINSSRVSKLRVLVYKDQFNLDFPIEVVVDGETVFHEKVTPDPEFMLRDFLINRDRKMLPVAEIKLDLTRTGQLQKGK